MQIALQRTQYALHFSPRRVFLMRLNLRLTNSKGQSPTWEAYRPANKDISLLYGTRKFHFYVRTRADR